ncbi:MAG: leucyl aminopeptidase family protein [Chakrabartia sp.]
MTHSIPLLQPDKGQAARAIHLIDPKGFDAWLSAQPERARAAVHAQGLTPKGYASAILPGETADEWSVVSVVANVDALSTWCLAKLAETLPEGTYRLIGRDPGPAMLGWLFAQYQFDRYLNKKNPKGARILLTADPAIIPDMVSLAEATALVRTLVNTPAADMGPADLQHTAEGIAKANGATVHVTKGHDLETGYPMIHAVGMAADKKHAPRLIEIEWGNPNNPRVAIIGKGVTFDSGGLNIKPGGSMRLMKKDMGGAAHALALAKLVMEARLPVHLHVLVAAAENAIAGNAFRPGDVLKSRNGMTVEIDNTDAEGRLVLADALTKAAEDVPALIIDYATLTGAARVALGPDLPALFTNDDELADALLQAGKSVDDNIWRMPLWSGYADMLKSDIADCVNSAEGGMAGAVTAALFLQKFVPADTSWAHFDTFAWRPAAKPGRPKGGDALGVRAAFKVLKDRYPAV